MERVPLRMYEEPRAGGAGKGSAPGAPCGCWRSQSPPSRLGCTPWRSPGTPPAHLEKICKRRTRTAEDLHTFVTGMLAKYVGKSRAAVHTADKGKADWRLLSRAVSTEAAGAAAPQQTP